MRLTSVAITFIFFGTVLATPIYPLRGNAVELSKRAGTETAMPGLTGGDGGGSDGEGAGERPTSPPPTRGRRKSRGRGGSISSVNKGKTRTDVLATEGQDSDGEIKDTTATGGRKRSRSGQGRSTSGSKVRRTTMVKQAQFSEAMGKIMTESTVGTAGSRSLGVYHIEGEVNGHAAVVKIIDDRLDEKEIRNEVARDRKADQLLGWGWKAAKGGRPKIAYILLMNMGVHVSKVPGLDLANQEDQDFVKNKKDQALAHHETHYGLKHTDPEGDGNFLWKHNPQGATKDEQYNVTPIDWEGAQVVSGSATAPPALVVPPNTFVPPESQKSSDKASTEGSQGKKTPPDGSPKSKPQNVGTSPTRAGLRSSSRKNAAASGSGTR